MLLNFLTDCSVMCTLAVNASMWQEVATSQNEKSSSKYFKHDVISSRAFSGNTFEFFIPFPLGHAIPNDRSVFTFSLSSSFLRPQIRGNLFKFSHSLRRSSMKCGSHTVGIITFNCLCRQHSAWAKRSVVSIITFHQ